MNKVKTKEEFKIKEPDVYYIAIINNDKTTMEGVMVLLEQIFNYTPIKAFELMLEIHLYGQSNVFEGPRDLATLLNNHIYEFCQKAPDESSLKELRSELIKKL